jgi:hypothetical protein
VPDTALPPPVDPIDDDRPAPTARRRISLAAAGVFTVATFGLWLYAFFIYDPGLKVDELADRTFPTAAEGICARYEARVDQLPPAPLAETAAQRADVIDEANEILRGMVGELGAEVPVGQGRITEGVEAWLDDWETHIADRQAYADALRTDSDARFLETIKANRQLSRAIDGFAEVNRMEACTTPGDVG